MNSKIPQHGSTSLGIIVGIVLGLAVALGVSLYLASSNMPIKDKAANPAAKTPNAPKDPASLPDPNESLYAKPKVDENKSDDSAAVDTTKSKTSPANSDTTPKTKIEDDPIGKIATAATPVKPTQATNSDKLYVQVGAYKLLSDAEATRAKMALLGIVMHIYSRDNDTGPIHRVRSLPLTATEAEKLREQLKVNGIDSTSVKVQ